MVTLTRRFSLLALCVFLSISSMQAHAINAKMGLWEWTTTLKIPGVPVGIPAIAYKSCITSKYLAPKLPTNSDSCKLTSHTVKEDRIDWVLKCDVNNNTFTHTGHLIYNDTTAMGESQSSSSNSSMSSMILGSYIGPCK